jgi:hypothetical protein
VIVSDFPEIFNEFREKWFSLLWRSVHDDFNACDFQDRCDGHANTLTLMENTKGNIFGGLTPLEWEWESRKWKWKLKEKTGKETNIFIADTSLKSFLCALKNLHNVPRRRLVSNAENFNANANRNTSSFGSSYTNNTGLDGLAFFTSSRNFQVKKIEVSDNKVIDSTRSQMPPFNREDVSPRLKGFSAPALGGHLLSSARTEGTAVPMSDPTE